MTVIAGILSIIPPHSPAAPPAQSGTNVVDIHLNLDVLNSLGVRIALTAEPQPTQAMTARPGYADYRFTVIPLDFTTFDLASGRSQVASRRVLTLGGLLLATGNQTIDLRGAFLKPSAGDPLRWTVEDTKGIAWFEIDHAHLQGDDAGLELHDANLRFSPAAGEQLKRKDWIGLVVGGVDLALRAPVTTPVLPTLPTQCQAPWSSPATPARIRLTLMAVNTDTKQPDTITFERCMRRGVSDQWRTCTADSHDGLAVFAPDASLKNVGESAVPWYPRFSGRHPPYDNDQHPFLIWNLYRLDADGLLHQIARSGVKHAFFAVNAECGCPSGHVVYPKCIDTYSSYNNDTADVLGPRNEVVPARGIWGRCGSVADPNCDGRGVARAYEPEDALRYRLAVSEHELESATHPSAEYFFEFGYLIRDADRADGAFGYRKVIPKKTVENRVTARWALSPEDLRTGLVIDRWVGPQHTAKDSISRDIATPDGHLRIAARVTHLANGQYRYQYAIANIDYARANISGEGDRMRVDEPHGISGISLPVVASARISNADTTAEDLVPGRPWLTDATSTELRWSAPKGNELTWGELISIHFDAIKPPHRAKINLHSGLSTEPDPHQMTVETLVPQL